jgi:hypothetical protein
MALVQLKQTGSLNGYVWEFSAQLSVLPKLDELAKKIVFFNGLQSWAERALFRMPRLPETCAEILKLAERIGDDEGPNKKAREGASAQESTKGNSKHQQKKHVWQKQKHGQDGRQSSSGKGGEAKKKGEGDNKPKKDASQMTCYNCGDKGHMAKGCTKPQVSTQNMRTHLTKHLLHGAFVAKASKTKPKPRLLFLQGTIGQHNVSFLLDIGAIHLLVSPRATKELGLQMTKASKPINVRFAKGKLHQTSHIATDVEVKCGKFSFVEDFTLCDMDEVDFILGNTFLDTYGVDIRRRPKVKVIANVDGKELELDIIKTPSFGGSQILLASIEDLEHDRFLVVMRANSHEGVSHGGA